MSTQVLIEGIGYLGSALVLVSFLMSSVVKLRLVNTAGSIIFAAYALIIHSYPTAIMNICLVGINIYYLCKLRHEQTNYRMLSMHPDETYVQDFLRHWADDINSNFPNRHPESAGVNRVYMVFHDTNPAGLLMGHEKDGVLEVDLDYSTPGFRDCSVGRYILEHLDKSLCIRYKNAESQHISYLKTLGFTDKDGVWEKQV